MLANTNRVRTTFRGWWAISFVAICRPIESSSYGQLRYIWGVNDLVMFAYYAFCGLEFINILFLWKPQIELIKISPVIQQMCEGVFQHGRKWSPKMGGKPHSKNLPSCPKSETNLRTNNTKEQDSQNIDDRQLATFGFGAAASALALGLSSSYPCLHRQVFCE